MNAPIAGVAPPELEETTSMVLWPSIAATRAGQLVGKLGSVGADSKSFWNAGKLLAIASIPIALTAFAWNLLPYFSRRYRLTNRRVVIHEGLSAAEGASIPLDEFDSVEIERLPGQEWLHAGEVMFMKEGEEVFRLSGVLRPETFCEVCLKARQALVSVREVMVEQRTGEAV
jgi:hypothetical protein